MASVCDVSQFQNVDSWNKVIILINFINAFVFIFSIFSGATCSGKTSVASMLENILPCCRVINQVDTGCPEKKWSMFM